MHKTAQRFFIERDILLVDTPALSRAAVSDPNVESISATLPADRGGYFLHTSPEFPMKRLLAAGFPDIAQICKVFRGGESGRRHQPEFTMAEWYRLGFDLPTMMADTEQFLLQILSAIELKKPPARLSYQDAFLQHAGLDPLSSTLDQLKNSCNADNDLIGALGDDRDAWLDLLLVSKVTSHFETDRLTTIYHYPASQAALSRLSTTTPEVADRFEIYCGEMELANGYVELTDAVELEARFAQDQEKRRRQQSPLRPLDENFIAAMNAGLPECAGVAVGMDRLLMILDDEPDIRRVQHFPNRTSA